MKQLQERDSRWRSARWKGQGWVQRAAVAALFDRPSRRCTELNAKIKKQRGSNTSERRKSSAKELFRTLEETFSVRRVATRLCRSAR